ncbi:MAG: LysR family transcriptional regulator [Pseudomonadota bacterium]
MTDWNDIKIFRAVITTGSFSAAARAAGTTQATISRRIKALETELGQSLFTRGLEGVSPTALAEELDHVTKGMDQRATNWARVFEEKTKGRRQITLACGELIGGFLSRHFETLQDGLSGVDIEIKASNAFVDIAAGEADLALRNKRPERGSLKVRKLRSSEYGQFSVFGSVEHYQSHQFTELSELQAETWISASRQNTTLPSAQWIAERIDPENIRFRMNSTAMILDAARSNRALALLPRFIGLSEPHLAEVFGPVEGIHFESWFVRRDEGRPDPAMDRLIANIEGLFE